MLKKELIIAQMCCHGALHSLPGQHSPLTLIVYLAVSHRIMVL